MLTRVVTGIVLLIATIAILFLGQIALGITLMVLTVVGIIELHKAVENGGLKPVKWTAFLFVVPILLYMITPQQDYFSIAVYTISALVFFMCIIKTNKYNLGGGVASVASGLVVSNMFFSIFALYMLGENRLESALILGAVLVGACLTDMFAYFVGVLIGKHKLCPDVSPKKTIEGSIGGMIFVTAGMAAYGYFVLNPNIDKFYGVSIYTYIALGLICGIVSQIGDLSASMIKRNYNIKDFGKIFPGHGGVLDRFDSFIFVAPVMYFFLTLRVIG